MHDNCAHELTDTSIEVEQNDSAPYMYHMYTVGHQRFPNLGPFLKEVSLKRQHPHVAEGKHEGYRWITTKEALSIKSEFF